jgi:ElaB/YqjD/DUF883 family membrane-anchored ribosome-binding protein
MNETRDTRTEKLADDFHAVLAETEELLKSVSSLGSEKAGVLRANVDQHLASAGEQLAAIREQSLAQAKAAAAAAEQYVQENPWRAVGIVALAGAVTGFVMGLLVSRR